MPNDRPPHPATLPRSSAVQPKMADERPPHPATLPRAGAVQPKMADERPPHPATLPRSSAVQPKMADERPPHPATIGRAKGAFAAQPMKRKLEEGSNEEAHEEKEQRVNEPEKKRPKREPRSTEKNLDQAKRKLASTWKGQKKAGKKNSKVTVASKSKGQNACAAEVTVKGNKTYSGEFDSDNYHAEMDALRAAYADGKGADDITKIEIEKEPCPRCAVVLKQLGLADKVTYKNTGQKDYPTWRYPPLKGKATTDDEWANVMGIAKVAQSSKDYAELLTYFRTQKWW